MAAFDFPSSPNVNDIYTLNGVAFMWNGSVWKRYSTSTGAQGFQGAAGAAGAQGAQGTNGTIGSDGAQGAAGAQGATGSGATGAQGAAGATGAQGAAGAQGAPFDRSEYNYTASGGQTAFAAAYANASDVDVFMNGVRLTPAEYTPSGGTTITLASGATAGDIIDILTFASAGPTGSQGAQGHQGDAFNRSESNFTATSGQTSFAPSGGYTNGDDLDVFVNGVRLTPADYTATNGTNVVLDVGANTGDIVDIIYYEAAGPAGAQGAAGIAGTVTFSTGAPSNPINGDLWYDTDDGAFAGYYDDGNTSQWIDLSGGPRGAQGATGANGAQGAAGSVPSNISAVSGTFSGNVSIGGTLTYEDVTNIDSVGVITARNGIIVNNASSTFDPHLTLFAENSNGGILIAKHASSYPGLEFRSEAGGGSLDLFKGVANEQAGNSSYYTGLKLNDNNALLMGTGGDSLVRYDPTPGVLEIKTLVSEPITLSTNDTERLRITSGGDLAVGATGDVYGPARLNIRPDNRQTQFSASDGNTWHDIVVKQNDTNASGGNAVGLAFEISTGGWHANAGTGIAAIKDSNSNDYGSHLAFITRPHAAVAEERLRITSAGKILVGTTSSSGNHILEVNSGTDNEGIKVVSTDAGSYIRFADNSTTGSTRLGAVGDEFKIDVASAERFRINSNGDATFKHKVNIGDSHGGGEILSLGKSSGTSYMAFHNGGANMGFIGYADQLISGGGSNELGIRSQDEIRFATGGNTERFRISDSVITCATGVGMAIDSGTSSQPTDSALLVTKQNNNDWALQVRNYEGNSTDYGFYCRSKNNSSYAIGVYDATNSSWRFRVSGGGSIYATNTSIGSISDQRLKENIVDANSQWDDIKALRFRNFNWREDSGLSDGRTYLGLIAQEVEPISPNLVDINAQSKEDIENEVPDPEYKNVKYSIVWMKAVKALQEAQTRIETLETQLTDALARITALEG